MQTAPVHSLLRLDATTRGIPRVDGIALDEVAGQGWSPARGDLALPALTLDEATFAANRDLFFAWAGEIGVRLAPHAKTPMAPDLARSLREAGAWATTVAHLQQAAVVIESGETRLLLANEIGGRNAGRRLGALLAAHPAVEIHAFADSPAAVAALGEAGRIAGRDVSVLVEVGRGRAGARDRAAVEAIVAAVRATPGTTLGGVATYEGAAATADPEETARAIAALLELTAEAFAIVRTAAPDRPLVLSAGGSAHFDRVVAALGPVVRHDGRAELALRSGAVFFSDHGVYARAFAAIDARGGISVGGRRRSMVESFRPTLTLWAEVLSRPEPGLAICGFGMRDVSFDQDLPIPLAVYREGGERATAVAGLEVVKLNDQHAFLSVGAGSDLAVGDIVAFGISHPCTCLDRWRVIYGLGPDGTVTRAIPTRFG
jgi:D-serine dehydratase